MSKDVPEYDNRDGKRENMPPGAPKPTISIEFDPATQGVLLKFDPKEFKSWDFIVAVLDMGKNFAEFQRNMVRAQAMQQQQQAAMQEVAIRNSIKL